MRREDNDPLPYALWLAQLERLHDDACDAAAEFEERAVRRAFYLFKLGPPAIRSLSDPYLSQCAVDARLERGEAVAAMRLIVGNEAKLKIEPGAAGSRFGATLTYDDGYCASGTGSTEALALVCAWTRAHSRPPS